MATVIINGIYEIELDDMSDASCHVRNPDLANEILDMHSLAVDERLENIDLSVDALDALYEGMNALEAVYA